VKMMVDHDLELARRERLLADHAKGSGIAPQVSMRGMRSM